MVLEKDYKKSMKPCHMCSSDYTYETWLKDDTGIIRDTIIFCVKCENAKLMFNGRSFDAKIFARLWSYILEIRD